MAATSSSASASTPTSAPLGRPNMDTSNHRKVFKLTQAGFLGLNGAPGGLAVDVVSKRVEAWAAERKNK